MPYFHTGLVITEKELELLNHRSLYPGANFIPDPTGRHMASMDGASMFSFSCFELRKEPRNLVGEMNPGLELVIEADDWDTANNDLSLIQAGLRLGIPNPPDHSCGLSFPLEVIDGDDPLMDSQPFWEQFAFENRTDIGLFTLNAAKGNRAWTYALEKYRFSLDLDCISAQSGDPRCGQVFPNTSPRFRTHVHQLASIVSAYSAIEELGLEIRASSNKPRFNKDGSWNMEIWNELESRLLTAGIDIDRKFNWILRGDSTSIHLDIPDSFGCLTARSDGEVVKDRELHVIEAIQLASWLRNKIASHKFRDQATSVSPYDVHNVQGLARILIMQKMGVWEYVQESNKIRC